jgi:hypothetical protein
MTTITRNSARLKSSIGRIAAIALMLVLSACTSGPPVQEMSDARQAIAVAREAGAAELAPDEFHAAEAYLASAQQKLSDKAYKQARRPNALPSPILVNSACAASSTSQAACRACSSVPAHVTLQFSSISLDTPLICLMAVLKFERAGMRVPLKNCARGYIRALRTLRLPA